MYLMCLMYMFFPLHIILPAGESSDPPLRFQGPESLNGFWAAAAAAA
jgi:hypothetical protein